MHQVKACEICTNVGHPTDSCPMLQEDVVEQVNMAGGVSAPRRQLAKTKKAEKEKEILNVFRKVEINIPLLEAIKQVPKYAKFLKDLCTHKRKLRGDERVAVGENVSAIFQRNLLPKCGDPDFYILDMGDEKSLNPSPILFGRPFLSTVRTKIDVNEGTLSMKFDGETVNFNIFEAMKYPEELNSVFALSVIESFVQETFELDGKDALEVALTKHLELGITLDVDMRDELHHAVEALHSLPTVSPRYEFTSIFVPEIQTKLLPSVVQAPELKLKPLPKYLKYAFIGDRETLPVIISAHLSPSQKDKLVQILRDIRRRLGGA
ncbi:uncharacterized protein [Coffea arabica]|uniref:Uncharacterized protein n=1 Tax=Coffea arabica TaxID=13443 RepID=A0ABM4VEI7_COFAR